MTERAFFTDSEQLECMAKTAEMRVALLRRKEHKKSGKTDREIIAGRRRRAADKAASRDRRARKPRKSPIGTRKGSGKTKHNGN